MSNGSCLSCVTKKSQPNFTTQLTYTLGVLPKSIHLTVQRPPATLARLLASIAGRERPMTRAELLEGACTKLAEVVLLLTAAGETRLAQDAEELAEQVEFGALNGEVSATPN